MKNLLLLTTALFLLTTASISSQSNVQIVQNLYDNFGKGDVPAVLAALHENVVWNEAEGNDLADGNPYVGPDAVLNGVFARVVGEHEYFKLKDIKLHDMSDNKVLATLRYDGKMKHNGAIVDAQAAHLWTLDNGKVVAFQQYVNTRHLAEAKNEEVSPDNPTQEDTRQIKEAVLNYLEGLDTNNPDRLAKSLHPDLAKRVIEKDENGHDHPSNMSAANLISYTKDFDFSQFYTSGVAADIPLEVDISIHGISNGIATVSATTNKFEFVDYIHLGKLDGEWKIINILWTWTGNTNKWLSGSK